MSRLVSKADVLYALAFTPYDAANPAGFIDAAYFNAHLPTLAAPKDSPAFTGPYSFAGQGTFLGLLDVQSGALNLNNTTPRLLMGRAGSPSTPNLDFLAGAAAGRGYDARITVSGGSSLLDGKGVINLVCNALTINGQSIATSGVGAPGTALPLMAGAIALVGVGTAFSREDHVHPSDTSRLANNAAGTITDGANAAVTLTISNTGSNGAKLKLLGNGGTTPSKTLRVQAGVYQVLNDAGTTALFALDDTGNGTLAGGLTANGAGTVTDGSASAVTLTLSSTANTTNGARLKLLGNGATTPSKTLQVLGGSFRLLNDAGASLLTVTDAGAATFAGAVSGITTLAMSGALTGVTSLTMAGALSGVTTLAMSGALSVANTGKFNANANASAAALAGNVMVLGADSSVPRIGSDSFAMPGAFSVRRANGTGASQSALANNDVIMQLEGRGYGATGYGSAARGQINIAAGAAWTDSDQSAYLAFITTAVGGTTTTEKMRLSAAGRLLIGSTSDNGTDALQVNGSLTANVNSSGSAAVPAAPTGVTPLLTLIGANGSLPGLLFVGYGVGGAGAGGLAFSARRANGTAAVPTTLVADDQIVTLQGSGYDGAGWSTTGQGALAISAAGTWSGTSHPTYVSLKSTDVGSTTQFERARIFPSGRVAINPAGSFTDNGTDALQVAGSASVNADPTTALQLTPKQYVDTRLGTRRNLIHNGLFRINQRATVSVTSNGGYVADRWSHLDNAAGSRTVAVTALTDSDRTGIGDEDAKYGLNIQTTGSAGAGDFEFIYQRVEGVNSAAGKTVTVSFWAKAAVAGQPIAVDLVQFFGSGGSPSAQVVGIGATKFSLTTSWVRYSVAIAVPSIVGKTLGTDGDGLGLEFWTSAGSTWNSRTGSIGQQTSNITIWGVQLEVAPAATPIEKLPMADEVNQCRRFYQTGSVWIQGTAAAAGALTGVSYSHSPMMRGVPTVTVLSTTGSVNVGSISGGNVNATASYLAGSAVAGGAMALIGTLGLSSDI